MYRWAENEEIYFAVLKYYVEDSQAIPAHEETPLHSHTELFKEIIKSLKYKYHWNTEKSIRACKELMRGLYCKVILDDDFCLPPQIDLVWEQAILNTTMYRNMCDDIFSTFFEHTTSRESIVENNHDVTAMMILYATFFNEDPPRDLWALDEVIKKEEKQLRRNPPRKAKKIRLVEEKENKNQKPTRSYQIFISTSMTTFPLVVSANMPIIGVKHMIQEKKGIPPDQQRILFAGYTISDNVKCWDAQVRKETTVNLLLKLRGC